MKRTKQFGQSISRFLQRKWHSSEQIGSTNKLPASASKLKRQASEEDLTVDPARQKSLRKAKHRSMPTNMAIKHTGKKVVVKKKKTTKQNLFHQKREKNEESESDSEPEAAASAVVSFSSSGHPKKLKRVASVGKDDGYKASSRRRRFDSSPASIKINHAQKKVVVKKKKTTKQDSFEQVSKKHKQPEAAASAVVSFSSSGHSKKLKRVASVGKDDGHRTTKKKSSRRRKFDSLPANMKINHAQKKVVVNKKKTTKQDFFEQVSKKPKQPEAAASAVVSFSSSRHSKKLKRVASVGKEERHRAAKKKLLGRRRFNSLPPKLEIDHSQKKVRRKKKKKANNKTLLLEFRTSDSNAEKTSKTNQGGGESVSKPIVPHSKVVIPSLPLKETANTTHSRRRTSSAGVSEGNIYNPESQISGSATAVSPKTSGRLSFRERARKTLSPRRAAAEENKSKPPDAAAAIKKVAKPRSRYDKIPPQIQLVAECAAIKSEQDILAAEIVAAMDGKDELFLLQLEIMEALDKSIKTTGICALGENPELTELIQHYKLEKNTTNHLVYIQKIFTRLLAECDYPFNLLNTDDIAEEDCSISLLIKKLKLLQVAQKKVPLYDCQTISQKLEELIVHYQDAMSQFKTGTPEQKQKLLEVKVRVDGPEFNWPESKGPELKGPDLKGPWLMTRDKARKWLGFTGETIPGRNKVVPDGKLHIKSEVPTSVEGRLVLGIEPQLEFDFSVYLRLLLPSIAQATTFVHINLKEKSPQPAAASNVACSTSPQACFSQARIAQVGLSVGDYDLADILNIMQHVHFLNNKVGQEKTGQIFATCVKSADKKLPMAAEKYDLKIDRGLVLERFDEFINRKRKEEEAIKLKTLLDDMQIYKKLPDNLNTLIDKQGSKRLFNLLDVLTTYPEIGHGRTFKELCDIPKYLCKLREVLPPPLSDLACIRDVLLNWADRFNDEIFCALVILMILSASGDAHERNIRVIVKKDSVGRVKAFDLSSFDNDHNLETPLKKDYLGEHLVFIKCILFCMKKLMEKPIATRIRDTFLRTTPEKFLNVWFSLLHQRDIQCEKVAKRVHRCDQSNSLPTHLFKQKFDASSIKSLYFRHKDMYKFIKNNPEATLRELLEHTYPIVGAAYFHSYEELLKLKNNNVRLLAKECHSIDRLFLLFKTSIEEMYGLRKDTEKNVAKPDKGKVEANRNKKGKREVNQNKKGKVEANQNKKGKGETSQDKENVDPIYMRKLLKSYDSLNDNIPKPKTKVKKMMSAKALSTNFNIPPNAYINAKYVARGLAPGGSHLFTSLGSPLQRFRTRYEQPDVLNEKQAAVVASSTVSVTRKKIQVSKSLDGVSKLSGLRPRNQS